MKETVKKITPKHIWKKLSMIKKRFLLPFRIDGRGERMNLDARALPKFESMNKFQKSHVRRYEFAAGFVKKTDVCGDLACGTGYGTVMLGERAEKALGVDIDSRVIKEIAKRYQEKKNVRFLREDLMDLSFKDLFDVVVSFETIEHFKEKDIPKLLSVFNRALKPGGMLIFSTPYRQDMSEAVLEAGFHLTFGIDEEKINLWLAQANFKPATFFYQNYDTHEISKDAVPKDIILGTSTK